MKRFQPVSQLPDSTGRIAAAATAGVPHARWLLGNRYLMGIGGVSRDVKAAAALFQKGAAQGCHLSQRALASLLESGLAGRTARRRAFAVWLQAANNADTQAQERVGRAYLYGDLAAPNRKKAEHYLQLAAWNGSLQAGRLLAILTATNAPAPESAGAIMLPLTAASEAGDEAATFALALCYLSGWGLSRPDASTAETLLRKAAAAGHAGARQRLGSILIDGEGAHQLEGFRWLHAAAQQGDGFAQAQLGDYFAKENGTDLSTARAWYARSATSGFAGAQWHEANGLLLASDQGLDLAATAATVERSLTLGYGRARQTLPLLHRFFPAAFPVNGRVISWLEFGPLFGDSDTMRYLAGIYLGEHSDISAELHDPVRGLFWLQAAVEEGDGRAMHLLGNELMSGEHCPRDEASAVALLNCAAARGEANAAASLAYHFNFSRGLVRNQTFAATLNEFAAVSGSVAGQHNLGTHFNNGEGVEPDRDLADYWKMKSAETRSSIAAAEGGLVAEHAQPKFERGTEAKVLALVPGRGTPAGRKQG